MSDRSTSFKDYGSTATYRGEVERSFDFMPGMKHDTPIKAKAQALLDLVERRLGDPAQLTFLDVGCGTGSMQRYVLPRVGRSIGVDMEAAAVDEARRTYPALEAHHYDGHTLPIASDSVDVAFTVNVMHHVPPAQRRSFTQELVRVVRPGGLAVVFEHNPLNPLTRLAVFRCAFDDDAILLHPGETRRHLQYAGAPIVEQRYVLFFPIDDDRLRRVEGHLRRVPLGAQYFVAAAKG
jgi:SAM-dependent methyltransferase